MKPIVTAVIICLILAMSCGGNNSEPQQTAASAAVPDGLRAQLDLLVEVYLELKDALVTSEPEIARQKANALRIVFSNIPSGDLSGELAARWQELSRQLNQSAQELEESGDLAEQRIVFAKLAGPMIRLTKTFGPLGKKVYVQHCPMALDGKGADWLSYVREIKNPYLGYDMQTCGTVTDSVSAKR